MTIHSYRKRYQDAYIENLQKTHPEFYKASGGDTFKFPAVNTANGLTKYIINFLLWHGYRATRISTTGRLVDSSQKQQSGVILKTKKWIKGTTRRGTADISATIKGRSVMIEVKAGRDRPSQYQLEEQKLERASGGVYEFCSTPDEFLKLYDSLTLS